MELRRHIEILLLRNDCVIVPHLGGFMAHHIPARYDEADHMFIPPIRTLGFNPQLTMSDSLLAQSYVDTYDLSFPEAVKRVEHEVQLLKERLEADGKVELPDLGTLQPFGSAKCRKDSNSCRCYAYSSRINIHQHRKTHFGHHYVTHRQHNRKKRRENHQHQGELVA